MHKGYAFVQFTSPFDARSACLGEDGRSISGQVIDVNMVSEPKPNHGDKKTSSSNTGNKGVGQKRTHGDTTIGEGGDDLTQVYTSASVLMFPWTKFYDAIVSAKIKNVMLGLFNIGIASGD